VGKIDPLSWDLLALAGGIWALAGKPPQEWTSLMVVVLVIGGVAWAPETNNFRGLIVGVRISNTAISSFSYTKVLADPGTSLGSEIAASGVCTP
jgi:hypothetical protein